MTQQALISMKATQFKKSKQWNSALKSLKMKDSNGRLFTPARFSHIWLMKSQPEENKNGSWHGWEISKDSQIELRSSIPARKMPPTLTTFLSSCRGFVPVSTLWTRNSQKGLPCYFVGWSAAILRSSSRVKKPVAKPKVINRRYTKSVA